MPREEVLKNQRERFFAALVVALAEKGYEETTLKDLARVSGVSSRSFYHHWADKHECYMAALQAMIEAAIKYAAALGEEAASPPTAGSSEEEWEAAARRASIPSR